MHRFLSPTLFAGLFAVSLSAFAVAQEPPALQGASPEEKARISALIEGAKKEGAVTYWDVVIQPETNDALTAEFRKYYGLPDSFKINYQLSATAALVTRVEQEIAADRITIDIAAVGSPSWIFERANAGDALEYDSPQYKFYANHFLADSPRTVADRHYVVPSEVEFFMALDWLRGQLLGAESSQLPA